MNRRSFFKTASVAGIGITTLPLQAKVFNENFFPTDEIFTYDFELQEVTIASLQQFMASKKYTSRAITQMYLDRIQKIDKNGPKVNSVIEINPDALHIADLMDMERSNGTIRSMLHGIPVLIKDNINTADKMQTTAGALALQGNIATKDAFLVKKLRDAGAVLLGKTNLSEWANFRSEKSTSGWSSRGGLTKNPYFLDRNPLGSSSGSGVSVSANLCTVAIGTETDGSIVCPSSVNGIVGLKPTVGLISRSGIIPISHTQDTAGPMTRTVEDLAILLSVIAGQDTEDPITTQSEGKAQSNYTLFLDKKALNGARIGYEKKWKSNDENVNILFEEALKQMKSQGAVLVEIELNEKINELSKNETEVLKYEFKDGVNKYLSKANASVKSLKEVIEYNKIHADKAMPYFKQDLLESCESKGDLSTKEYQDAVFASVNTSRSLIQKTLKDNNLQAITGITMSPAGVTDLIYGDKFGDQYSGMAAAISGYPHITVPCGRAYGLPVGISFYSEAYTEAQLIALAYSFEQSTKQRSIPQFKNTIGE